jgi:hypothetical protein
MECLYGFARTNFIKNLFRHSALIADIFESEKLNYAEREGMVDALILQSDLANVFPQYKKQSIGKVRRKLLKSILQ